ncbi:putative Integral membrane protein [Seiridium cardinale]|uniref:Integral membrane protein n=1 Tax=Seiridium cardinale TaxID=138064 RepID=A0ABR2Y0F1_9PEZI
MRESLNSPEYIGWRLEVFVGVFTPLQVLFVALRCYARALTASPWALDDWFIVISLLGQIVAGGIAIGSVRQSAVGHHIGYLEETNPEAVTLFFKYLVAISAWYYATIWISKLAICLLYLRLFPQKTVRVIMTFTAGVLISTSVASIIADLAACTPFSATWGPPEVQATHCINKEALFIWSTLPNIVTDVIMLVLPMPIVWRLHTSTQMKGALTVTFLIGGVGLAASILRFWAFSNTNSFTDATYNAVELIIWTVVEPGIYLLSGCMLMFRPILERLNIHSLKIGSKNRSKGYSPYTISQHGPPQVQPYKGDGSIALRSHATNGFEQLADGDSTRDLTSHARPQTGGSGLASQNIRITTNIRQSWNQV